MISRVTNQTLMLSAQQNLQSNQARLAQLQDQASTLKAFSRPSDDPTATASSLRVRGQQAASAQYSRNIDNGNGWLNTIDTALTGTTDILRKVRDLTVQGSNGPLSQAGKNAIAIELDALKSDLLAQANTTFMGRTVFAGNSDTGAAFTNTTPPIYTGTGSSVDRRIGDGTTVRVDADGAAIFGTGTGSAFTLIDTIASNLRSGTDISTNLPAIDDRLNAVISQHAQVGSRSAQIQKAQSMNKQQQLALETQRSGIEDIDLSKAILDLQLQQTNYQAALAVTAKVLPPTLMDFLK